MVMYWPLLEVQQLVYLELVKCCKFTGSGRVCQRPNTVPLECKKLDGLWKLEDTKLVSIRSSIFKSLPVGCSQSADTVISICQLTCF